MGVHLCLNEGIFKHRDQETSESSAPFELLVPLASSQVSGPSNQVVLIELASLRSYLTRFLNQKFDSLHLEVAGIS